MRTRTGKEPVVLGGDEASRTDGLDSLNGGGTGNGSITEAPLFSFGTGRAGREGEDAVSEKTWFAPVSTASPDTLSFGECKDGVCPVPWMKGTFLEEDRNSNFPNENTIVTFDGPPVIKEDEVNHPSHYTGTIECIEAIEAELTPEEYRGDLKGNIAKYIWRERSKGGITSLKKAQWYLDRLVQFDEIQNG